MINQNPKRSNEPPVWLMFSAGGMISGLAFPVLILILGLLLPFGLVSPDNIIAFAHHWLGKLVILALTISQCGQACTVSITVCTMLKSMCLPADLFSMA